MNRLISRDEVLRFIKSYLEANEDDIREAYDFDYIDDDFTIDEEQVKLFDIHFKHIVDTLGNKEL